jgi:hypothetical protein
MSFDLFIYDGVEALDSEAVADCWQVLEEEGRSPDVLHGGRRAESFCNALTSVYPNLGQDPGYDSPFASTVEPYSVDGFSVNISWSRVTQVAPDVVRLALEHGLGVYDPQVSLTYNPARVVTVSDVVLQSPWAWVQLPAQQPLIGELVTLLGKQKDDPYCILERPDEAYMQTLATPEGNFVLEHSLAGGGPRFHLPGGADAKTVVRALEAFALRRDAWTALPWEEISI